MMYVCHYSGGLSSHLAAFRMSEQAGRDAVVLLFADTKGEDPDTYRFIREGAAALGCRLEVVADGRTIWQVFKDVKFLGNSRVDPCSRILKRELLDRWCCKNMPGATHVFGYTSCEVGRAARLQERFNAPVRFPLMENPTVSKSQIESEFREYFPGIEVPRLYRLGAEHNNCGGGCVKAGHKHFKWLLETIPELYYEWERNEQEIREFLGKDVSILKDRTGGTKRPLTLREFRVRIQTGGRLPVFQPSVSCMCGDGT